MRKRDQRAGVTVNKMGIDQARTRIELAKTLKEQAKTRSELVKTRREQAKTRAELARTRAEQTKTRVELAKARKKKNGIRTEQVEKTLQRVVHKEFDMHDLHQKILALPVKELPLREFVKQKSALERLTNRQREILQLIAESQNTKQIAGILKVSSKTVEYHRRKLMTALNVYDIPRLVRFALRAGLIQPES
jgi:DNA-binding NarL/FixJ family response regulator